MYLVTFCGSGVKPNPRLSDITSAAAPKDVTPSGTDIFPLIQVLSLTDKNKKQKTEVTFNLLSRFWLECVFAVNLLNISVDPQQRLSVIHPVAPVLLHQ